MSRSYPWFSVGPENTQRVFDRPMHAVCGPNAIRTGFIARAMAGGAR